MRLGLNVGYWGSTGDPHGGVELAREAERLGFSVVWAAEAYGSDAVTVLTWLAAHTTSIDIGSAVLQIPARSAAMTAMTAATLDTLSDGRFRLGLGVSGPQVSEGWHGVPFDRPLVRTREYVDVVRLALSRKAVRYEGEHVRLPLPDGPGKALTLGIRPRRADLPIYLAAMGPKNLELAGEIADGWHAMFFVPELAADQLDRIHAGRQRRGLGLSGFDVVPTVPMVVGDDVESCAQQVRGYAALYIGGMGSRQQNFYNDLAHRLGYGDAAEKVRELFLSRNYADAAAAVPTEFIERTALVGPIERIALRMSQYAAAGVTTLTISVLDQPQADQVATVRVAAEALRLSGVAGEDHELD